MKTDECILFSGGATGAKAEFSALAERRGIEEVNFTFDGHNEVRHRGVRVLNHEELDRQYAVSKFALRSLADSLSTEVNADGVPVLTVYPGRTATPTQATIHASEDKPYDPGSLAQPEDIA